MSNTNKNPYSVTRLLNFVSRLTFHSEFADLEDDDGAPSECHAIRNLNGLLRRRRDERDATYDPIDDPDLVQVRVKDLAIVLGRYRELSHLEDRLGLAVGPPCTRSQWNKRTGEFEDMGSPDDYGD
jgi:hypothetical protein